MSHRGDEESILPSCILEQNRRGHRQDFDKHKQSGPGPKIEGVVATVKIDEARQAKTVSEFEGPSNHHGLDNEALVQSQSCSGDQPVL